MEKVTIKKAVHSNKNTASNNPMISIELEDGRKGTAYTEDALNWIGKTIELDVKIGQKINDVQYYNFTQPTTKKTNFHQKDFFFEKRNASLQRAIETIDAKKSIEVTTTQILAIAEKYYEYLNKK